ncbi:MAG TPA: response regulator [Anaerolineae bacterium]|nr:response regulator [Anaerolineae bacterium]HQK15124.1 response regulator [Anaerolineae bacterium]
MALILLIEDSPLMRPALRDLLQLDGHTVITTEKVDEALKLLRDIPGVDLVIADYTMPDMDGATLIQNLREDQKYRTTPILMLALKGDQRVGRQAVSVGADECLTPPITVAMLRHAVAQMLNGHRVAQRPLTLVPNP